MRAGRLLLPRAAECTCFLLPGSMARPLASSRLSFLSFDGVVHAAMRRYVPESTLGAKARRRAREVREPLRDSQPYYERPRQPVTRVTWASAPVWRRAREPTRAQLRTRVFIARFF